MATASEWQRLADVLDEVMKLLNQAVADGAECDALPPGMYRKVRNALNEVADRDEDGWTTAMQTLRDLSVPLPSNATKRDVDARATAEQALDNLHMSGAALDVRLTLLEGLIEDYLSSGAFGVSAPDAHDAEVGWIRRSARRFRRVLSASSVVTDSLSGAEELLPAPARLALKGVSELFDAVGAGLEWWGNRSEQAEAPN